MESPIGGPSCLSLCLLAVLVVGFDFVDVVVCFVEVAANDVLVVEGFVEGVADFVEDVADFVEAANAAADHAESTLPIAPSDCTPGCWPSAADSAGSGSATAAAWT